MGEPWEDCDNKCLRAGKCVTGRCDVLTDMHGAVVDIFPKDPPPAEPSGQVVGETLLRNDNPPGGVVSLAEAVLLGKPLTIMNDAGEWVGEGMHAERLPQYHTPSAPPTTAHPVRRGLELQKSHAHSEVGEHELDFLNVVDGLIEVRQGPQLVSSNLSTVPSQRLDPSESIAFLMSPPKAMHYDVSFGPRVIDLCKQVRDNFREMRVLDLDVDQGPQPGSDRRV